MMLPAISDGMRLWFRPALDEAARARLERQLPTLLSVVAAPSADPRFSRGRCGDDRGRRDGLSVRFVALGDPGRTLDRRHDRQLDQRCPVVDVLMPGQPVAQETIQGLRASLHLLLGFFFGCVVAALAVSWAGDWAWLLPALLAGVAVLLG
jgi:hypothetical protein